jgi:hypothetical protein
MRMDIWVNSDRETEIIICLIEIIKVIFPQILNYTRVLPSMTVNHVFNERLACTIKRMNLSNNIFPFVKKRLRTCLDSISIRYQACYLFRTLQTKSATGHGII